jgi:hypothetical protein
MHLPEQRRLGDFSAQKPTSTYPLTLWFDSSKEAKDFADLLEMNKDYFKQYDAEIQGILDNSMKYVKHKSYYRKGVYWPLIDIQKMKTTANKARAPESITRLSQWQHHDFVIANQFDPMLAVEVTEHILTWNNVAQRIPRLVLSASYGVPSVILQKIDKDSKDKYKGWFLQALSNSTKIFKTPCVALLFDESGRTQNERLLSTISCNLIDYICFKNKEALNGFEELLLKSVEENQKTAEKMYDVDALLSCSWLRVDSKEVCVLIGVRPEDSMWNTKGTGGLDPYPGLVLLADLLLCRTGPKKSDRSRKLVVEFSRLKEDFWWFKKFPEELYLQLLIDEKRRIADEVVFRGG